MLIHFARTYHISYPLLADRGSAIIRKFDILNGNVPTDVRFYGIPFPGQYLVAADGTVRAKYFMSDYQERPTASEVVLSEFATVGGAATVVKADDVQARIALSDDHSVSGHQLGVMVEFAIAPGWHIYGEPMPAGEGLIPTSVHFDDELIARESLEFPKPAMVRFPALDQTYPVYQGNFKAIGKIVLKPRLKPGDYTIRGTVNFQECNDAMCKMPQSAGFQLPLRIEPMTPAAPKT